MKEKLIELDNALMEGLKKYGFSRQKKCTYRRKIEQGMQTIFVSTTKTRGKEEVHIFIFAGFSYPDLNKIIYFIRDEEYDKTKPTALTNISSLVNSKEVYGFYINANTDIVSVVENIILNINNHVLPFLDSCDTLVKYESMLLKKDAVVSRCILKWPEWSLLALSLLLNRQYSDDVIEEYYSEFARDIKKLEIAKEQIKKFNQV